MAHEPTVLEKQAAELERDAYEAVQTAIMRLMDAEAALHAEERLHTTPSVSNQRRLAFITKMMWQLSSVESELHQTMSSKPRANSMDPGHYPT